MFKKIKIKYKGNDLPFKINIKNLIYHLETSQLENIYIKDEGKCIYDAIQKPFGTKILNKLLKSKMKITIVIDDITRPTPQKKILPILIKELNDLGINDELITIIVALGTHRYLNENEIRERIGLEIFQRVNVKNNEWKEPNNFIDLGKTDNGTPVKVNKEVYNSDFIIGIGSIFPHAHAGWSGGAKIIQPGVCGWETTGATHMIVPRDPQLFGIAGNINNPFRKEIEEIAKKVGLNFIINTIVNPDGKIYAIVAGDPIIAHRKGVKKASEFFTKPIKELADIIIVSAYPGEIDYWTGATAVFLAQKGLKEGGVTILVGEFAEGISPTHSQRGLLSLKSVDEIEGLIESGGITDLVCAGDLIMHARLLKRTKVICLSSLKKEETISLGFESANSIEEAIERAFMIKGKNAKVGVINDGWQILPEIFS
jgi:nickel-dependent lactate racemase